jgi:hypothetical protein
VISNAVTPSSAQTVVAAAADHHLAAVHLATK